MQSLKKYFTEGLIQVAILLSLVGIRVDVDPYLPPWSEIIQGQSSALTQTQFHNLRNSLDGYSLHPKSVDLDGFFTTRRLLRWVHSLDHLRVPAAQLETWLVHREPDNSVVTISAPTGALEEADGLVDIEESVGLNMRMGGGGIAELGYGPVGDDNLEEMSQLSRSQLDNEDNKEGTEEMWQQELNHNFHQQQLTQDHNQRRSLFIEDDEDELMVDSWRNANPFHNPMASILREDVQFAGLEEDTSMYIEECLQLLENNLDQQQMGDDNVETLEDPQLEYHQSVLSPLFPEQESLQDLEQQWQDVLAIMDPQVPEVNDSLDRPQLNSNIEERARERGRMENSTQQDAILQQTELQRCSKISIAHNASIKEEQPEPSQSVLNYSNMSFNLNDSDIMNFLLSPAPDSSAYNLTSPSIEEQDLSSIFGPLLEETMFEEVSLLDLALEEGFNQSQVFQTEEQNQTDSDSGLSLDFSQSPVSPSGSESSCSSSSSSCSSSSMSSTELTPEEGTVGYVHIKEELTDEEEEGAVGGYSPDQGKMSYTNYLDADEFNHLPWLEHIGHDHTYNQPQCIIQRKSPKQCSDESLDNQDNLVSRDEKRAHAMKIPFSNDFIVNLPVEEFNELLAKHRLSEAQLTLIRDIRRRGKNKMAAQNCRRRKLDVLQGLEHSVDGLRRQRSRLLREKSEVSRTVREMKQRLNDLYQEVYSLLREEQGMLCSLNDFVLEQDNSRTALSTHYRSESRRKSGRRQRERD